MAKFFWLGLIMPKRKTVLLLENDREIALIITYILEGIGCEVFHSSPETYFTDISSFNSGVIIVDYRLDNIFGSSIINALKQNNETAKIPVILTSAVNNIEQIAAQCNADDVLPKPFDIEDLESKVLKWLNLL
jgi:CheY-like chemotaxis protein